LKNLYLNSLEKISEPYYTNIKRAILKLANNPRPQGYKKLKGRDGYRIRVANYRIIYDTFDNILLIEVIEIGHRKEIYD
jgi:mRNA interferase RelE/StbE